MIYSIASDTLNGAVSDSLEQEIRDSNITIALSGISIIGDVLDISFKADLVEPDISTLNSLIANHTGVNLQQENVIKYQAVLPEGGKKKTDRGFKFVATAGVTTSHDFLVTSNLQVKGGVLYTDNQSIMDQVYFELVDTGYLYAGIWYPAEYAPGVPWSVAIPTGVPLHMYIGDFPVDKDGITKFDNDAITTTPLNGLTMRVTYKSTGILNVNCNVGIVAYT